MSGNRRGKQPIESSYPTFRPYHTNSDVNNSSPPISQSQHRSQQRGRQQMYVPPQNYTQDPSPQYRSPNSVYQTQNNYHSMQHLSRNLNGQFDIGEAGISQNQYENYEVHEDENTWAGGIDINQPANNELVEFVSKTVVQRKWGKEEQSEVAYCWIQCSKDPKKGTSQSEANFWDSVSNLFNSRHPNNPVRSVDSLKTQWKRLNAACQKWNEIMSNLQRRQESGATDSDMLEKANVAYAVESKGGAFNLLHVYNLLKTEDKWSGMNTEHTAFRFAPRRMNSDSSPGDSDPQDSTPLHASDVRRAPGKHRMKNKVDYSSQYEVIADRMASIQKETKEMEEVKDARRQEKWLARQEERQRQRQEEIDYRNEERIRHHENLEMKKEKIRVQEQAAIVSMLTCDLSKLDPIQRIEIQRQINEYHQRRDGSSGH